MERIFASSLLRNIKTFNLIEKEFPAQYIENDGQVLPLPLASRQYKPDGHLVFFYHWHREVLPNAVQQEYICGRHKPRLIVHMVANLHDGFGSLK